MNNIIKDAVLNRKQGYKRLPTEEPMLGIPQFPWKWVIFWSIIALTCLVAAVYFYFFYNPYIIQGESNGTIIDTPLASGMVDFYEKTIELEGVNITVYFHIDEVRDHVAVSVYAPRISNEDVLRLLQRYGGNLNDAKRTNSSGTA